MLLDVNLFKAGLEPTAGQLPGIQPAGSAPVGKVAKMFRLQELTFQRGTENKAKAATFRSGQWIGGR